MIFETMKDLVNRVKLELEAEKRDRETSEENILGLIENACTKLGALNIWSSVFIKIFSSIFDT